MWRLLTDPWPWYVTLPLIGLLVPLLLLLGNKQLGMSGSLRAICACEGRVVRTWLFRAGARRVGSRLRDT